MGHRLSNHEIKIMRENAYICNNDLSVALDAYERLLESHDALLRMMVRISTHTYGVNSNQIDPVQMAKDALAAYDRKVGRLTPQDSGRERDG